MGLVPRVASGCVFTWEGSGPLMKLMGDMWGPQSPPEQWPVSLCFRSVKHAQGRPPFCPWGAWQLPAGMAQGGSDICILELSISEWVIPPQGAWMLSPPWPLW